MLVTLVLLVFTLAAGDMYEHGGAESEAVGRGPTSPLVGEDAKSTS
jgi:hypothetical protein